MVVLCDSYLVLRTQLHFIQREVMAGHSPLLLQVVLTDRGLDQSPALEITCAGI